MNDLDPYVLSKSLRRWQSLWSPQHWILSSDIETWLLDRSENILTVSSWPYPFFLWLKMLGLRPANFTSNAKPDQIGSNGGQDWPRLFHEGGHAAHFANVKWMHLVSLARVRADLTAYAGETQSMPQWQLVKWRWLAKTVRSKCDGQPAWRIH